MLEFKNKDFKQEGNGNRFGPSEVSSGYTGKDGLMGARQGSGKLTVMQLLR